MPSITTPEVPTPIRVGILGAGFIADYHLKCLQKLRKVTVAAICDSDRQKALRLQQAWNIPAAYSSLEDMLNEAGRLDVVHILVPPQFHAVSAISCMEAGCNVFIEKPVATSIEDCLRLKVATKQSGLIVGVNHNLLFHPGLRRLVYEIQACRFGEVQHVIACANVPLRQLAAGQHAVWPLRSPGNIIFEQGPHLLCLVHKLVGTARTISCLRSGEKQLNTGSSFFDTWQVSMTCERGSAQCFLSFGKEYEEYSIHVIGEDACGFLDLQRNIVRISQKTRFSPPVDFLLDGVGTGLSDIWAAVRNFTDYVAGFLGAKSDPDLFSANIRASIGAFYRAIQSGNPPPVTLDDATAVLAMCEGIVRNSADNGAAQKKEAACKTTMLP